MKINKSIGMLVCYYGKLPWYFHYFLHSCRYNPTVDFFIITDDGAYKKSLPQNVKLIIKSLDELKQLINNKLGFETNIIKAYKLCDFKPAYGYIFSELLDSYDFWGHCDIDLVFGNIRDFVVDELLEEYELISVRPDWIPGCFLLFKNIPKMNMLYTHSKDFEKIFRSAQHYCFDETNFTHKQFEEGKSYHEIKSEVESMMHVVKKMEAGGFIKPYFDLHIIEGGSPGRLKWENGKIIYKNRFEVLLYHLIDFKRHYISPKKDPELQEKYTISTSKIYISRKPALKAPLVKLNFSQGKGRTICLT